MRFAVIPLIISAALHVLGFALVGFAYESLFLIFPAMLYCLLSFFLLRGNNWAAWLTLVCMIGGIAGTSIEFMGPLMAPSFVLIGIITSDAAAAGLLVRGLCLDRVARKTESVETDRKPA
jgi:crotonobetainyl-CoA:carnitine CoA-transferase CaiB-like acyl-CoA transferase